MDGLVKLRGLRGVQPAIAVARARRTQLVLTDCDGVLTDAGVYLNAQGEELLRFSRRDGMGAERLRAAGISVGIVTREKSPIVEQRAAKMKVELFAGIRDKRAWLDGFLLERDLHLDEIAYMGDDVNDLDLINMVAPHGLCAAPADAERPVAEAVHLITERGGGQGAFREFAELLIALREVRGPVALDEGGIA